MKNILLSANVQNVIGTIAPPVNDPIYTGDVNVSFAKLISTGIQFFILFAGLATFFYLLAGALDWINSGGEKEKLQRAKDKIQAAVIGILLLVVVMMVFNLVMGTILGGKFGIGEGMTISLPHL